MFFILIGPFRAAPERQRGFREEAEAAQVPAERSGAVCPRGLSRQRLGVDREDDSKGGISRLAQMRKPQCTVVHEDFRIKRNDESTLLSCPPLESVPQDRLQCDRAVGLAIPVFHYYRRVKVYSLVGSGAF